MPKTMTIGKAAGRRTSNPVRGTRRRRLSDVGQTAIVMVVALSVLMMTLGALLVQQTVNTDPLLSTDTIQHYAYRGLEAGLNAYQSVVNINPNLANCTNLTKASAICQNAQYDVWNTVHGTTSGGGTVPEYYLFDNPQPTFNADGSLKVLKVQIVGAAGFPGKIIYQSTTANFSSANGFLDNVWWSDLESTTGTLTNPAYRSTPQLQPPATPIPGKVCQYNWNNGYNGPNGPGETGNCYPVAFGTSDHLVGPVFSNDSIYIDGAASLSSVSTADPGCVFVDDTGPNYTCTTDASVPAVDQKDDAGVENPPTDDTELQDVASEASPNNGCLYYGPTEITLMGTQMKVVSPDTTTASTGCPLGATAGALPPNGVLFVAPAPPNINGGKGYVGANPFDDKGTYWGTQIQSDNGKYAQTCGNYTNPNDSGVSLPCYFGQQQYPDAEGDAFVQGYLASSATVPGLLTIGTANDIIIDGNLTYSDCTTWATPTAPNASACQYNGSGKDDALGLIAYNYVEVNHPIDTSIPSGQSGYRNTLLGTCGGSYPEPAPLCEPISTVNGTADSIIVDAALLALQGSFGANNFGSGVQLGNIYMYGSIEQESRGAIANGTVSGFTKWYTWDPRLELVAPPSYLTPNSPSYDLLSSSISNSLTLPTMNKAYSATTPNPNAVPLPGVP